MDVHDLTTLGYLLSIMSLNINCPIVHLLLFRPINQDIGSAEGFLNMVDWYLPTNEPQ